METLGNPGLLNHRKIGYFASGTIASLSVLPTFDWAGEVAKRDDVAVVSGFHSRMEREVLEILLKGRCGLCLHNDLAVSLPTTKRVYRLGLRRACILVGHSGKLALSANAYG